MKYEVWAEGYQTNGESSGAFLLGTYEGESFDDAVLSCMMDPKFLKNEHLFTYNLGNGRHRYWGCRLFDNESDARVSFG